MAVRLRVDLAYDGTPFFGFARQDGVPTVQGTLEQALTKLLGQAIATVGAGRTDRGVHADGQVVHADVDDDVPAAQRMLRDLDELRRRLDHLAGDAIAIRRVRHAPRAFHARFSATAREYRYRIHDGAFLHPLARFDTWRVDEPLRVAPMRRAARALVGEHDFSSFCRRSGERTLVRRVDRVAVTRLDGVVEIRVRGASFCHQQVRSMVGCLVEVGAGRRPESWIAQVLGARDRAAAARIAPPHGLTLVSVSYGRRSRA